MAADLTDPTVSPGPGYGWDDNWGRWIWNGDPNAKDPRNTAGTPVDPHTGNPTWAPAPTTTPPVAPPTSDKKTTPPSTVGGLLTPFGGTMPTVPSGTDYLPTLPVFTPPSYTPPPAYASPTAESVLNEPGYQFRLSEGERALQQSAAARGVLNTGGTLKNILGYGQNFASGEYSAADQREHNNYLTNYNTQYVDPYAIAYKGAVDAFAPKMQGYQTQSAASQHASDLTYQNLYEQYLQKFRQFTDQRDSTFDKTYKTVTA